MKYTIVENGVVSNVILWDGEEAYLPPEGCQLCEVDEEVSIGWTMENGVLVPPVQTSEPEVPEEDPTVVAAKLAAVQELVTVGVSEATARTIVGLPPLSE